ncbi:hypothetical protein ANCCAN_04201 [Ancylostoma caninum]|uniref:Uncharacterized protein n=1 Tax=Ancylostoma caninum TaxID=29170 RepID=A0A368H383_ANCCA|nr:hypothetical protein ANCCAN_04201 [Ancylostoma caninum]
MEHGLDPEVVDDFGTTPMSEAKRKNFKDIIDVMSAAMEKRRESANANPEVFKMEEPK